MKDALGHGSNGRAATALASGPKSAPATVHSAMEAYSTPDRVASRAAEDEAAYNRDLALRLRDFTSRYGGPRNRAVEQRSFNSGKREIARLKRQGR